MKGQAVYKVPGGKLLKVSVDFEEDVIERVKVSGDFFAHPEESIELIEEALVGAMIGPELEELLEDLIEENGIELYGVDVESIVTAIHLARECGETRWSSGS